MEQIFLLLDLERLGLIMGHQRDNDIVKHTGKHMIEFIQGQIYSMICHPALMKIVGPDPFTAVSTAYLTFPVF